LIIFPAAEIGVLCSLQYRSSDASSAAGRDDAARDRPADARDFASPSTAIDVVG
jgi:hypothetical protein